MEWIADHFYLIRFDDEATTIEAIIEKARAAVMRHGIRGLVIDPYNEIEHRRPPNMTETEYVSRIASPEMIPEAEMLPHLICSRPIFIGGANDEADQHGGA